MLVTGTIGLILIEGTMFAILIATYFYLRLGVAIWPPRAFASSRFSGPRWSW